MDAVHEMLMQSFGDKVRVFPAVPESWKEASFTDLCAEGGFIVSAKRIGGLTREVRIKARCDSILRLQDPFSGREAKWNLAHETQGDCFVFKLRAGEIVQGDAIDKGARASYGADRSRG